jgi:outer membrane protein TolC
MRTSPRNGLRSASWAALCLAGLAASPLAAQEAAPAAPAQEHAPPAAVRITLEEAKHRALGNNKLLNLASLNAESKAYAVKAMQANYFPQVVGQALFLHFNDPLGTVLTVGRHADKSLLNKPLLALPPQTFEATVYNQDTSIVNIAAVQPLTDLLKVRQGVKIARADEQIAQAQLEKGIRELMSGVEQLYWGLLAARRIQAGAVEGARGAEALAKTGLLEARLALVEAQQGLQAVNKQIADVQEQLDGLLDLPLCTTLELVEPPLPALPFACCDEVVGLALAASPDIKEAQQTVLKAEAALKAGKLEYVPSIALVGGYLNQTLQSYVQQDIGYVGVVGTYTFVDWGKRKNVIRERHNLVGMANLKLQQTEQDVRQRTAKLFREVVEAQQAITTATQLSELRKEAVKKATTPEAFKDPTVLGVLLKASKDLAVAEVDAVKADLAYREAYVKLMSLIGK